MERIPDVRNMIAAFDALSTVLDANFKCSADFGEPFKITATGRCSTVCNAAGWLVQHPFFKKLGLTLEKGLNGKYQPLITIHSGKARLSGYSAISYALGLDTPSTLRIFAPYFYTTPSEVTMKEVLRRLKTAITRVGGQADFKAFLKASKPPRVKKLKAKKAKKGSKADKPAVAVAFEAPTAQ